MYKGASEPLTMQQYPIEFPDVTTYPIISTRYGIQSPNPITTVVCSCSKTDFGFVVFMGNSRVTSDTQVGINMIVTGH